MGAMAGSYPSPGKHTASYASSKQVGWGHAPPSGLKTVRLI